ncbi:nitronate monooxygenase [uncultured Shimia sp.]|uniref:NAD(P)H-dependent flavin oxidoreductase n=1 Tax=uncultured Shimia sp. TaxID=573152 RepID=UPI0025E284CD|nr:nitronate monooxygenase [uncultured Shimia sp.]
MELTAVLGLKWPLLQAPMAGVSTPEMAAAVSNAGGLGALGLGAAGVDGAQEMLRAAQALTDRRINANVFCHAPALRDADVEADWLAALAPTFARFGAKPPEALHEIYRSFVVDRAMCDMLIEEAPGVVSLHFGLPDTAWIAELQAAGNLVFASATTVDEAQACVAAGVDAIVAQGIEAGGHRGVFDPDVEDEALSTLVLVERLVAACEVPVIAAGGLMDGGDVARALARGAAAAQLGTAFLDCTETAADDAFRAALRDPEQGPPVLTTSISGRAARCMRNDFITLSQSLHAKVPDYPVTYDAGKALNAAAKAAGEGGFGAQWAGTGVARVRSGGAAEILEAIGAELDAART